MGRNIFAFLLCLALSLILTVCVSCGGGGGGATLHDSSSNPLHHDGSTGGWGAGTSSNNNGGAGGSNGSSGSASEGKLFSLFPYFNPSISTIDISLSINGASPVVLTGLDSSTPKSVLPEMNIGDIVSGNALIHLSDGSTRNAVCPQREITIDNYLAFITDFRCTLKNTLTDTTLVQNLVFTTAVGIDMSPYASALVSPVALYAWKDTRTGAMYPASGIVYPRAGDAILETVWAAAVPVITYKEKSTEAEITVSSSSAICNYSYLEYGDSVTDGSTGGMPVTIKSSNGSAINGTITPVTGGTPVPFNGAGGQYSGHLNPGTYKIFGQVSGGESSTTTLTVGIRPVNVNIATWEIYPEFKDEGGASNIEIYGDGYFKSSVTPETSVQVFHYVENHAKGCSYHNWTIFGSNSTAVTLYNHSDYVTVSTTNMYEDDSGALNSDDPIGNLDETLTLQELKRSSTFRKDTNGSDWVTHQIEFNLSEGN